MGKIPDTLASVRFFHYLDLCVGVYIGVFLEFLNETSLAFFISNLVWFVRYAHEVVTAVEELILSRFTVVEHDGPGIFIIFEQSQKFLPWQQIGFWSILDTLQGGRIVTIQHYITLAKGLTLLQDE